MDTATPRKLPPTPDSYPIAEQTYHNGCHLLDPLIFTRCNNTRELYKPPAHGYERRDSFLQHISERWCAIAHSAHLLWGIAIINAFGHLPLTLSVDALVVEDKD